ncbi:MAG: DUF1330 domain-containing protein [Actinomycetota bacterium]
MAAYVIVNVTVHDAEAYKEYVRLAPPTIAAYGGRYLARAGNTEILEGDWKPNRLVILEFDSAERVKAWLDSPEYSAVKHLRHNNATSDMVVIEGLEHQPA